MKRPPRPARHLWSSGGGGGLQGAARRPDAEQHQCSGEHAGRGHHDEGAREAPRGVGAEHDERGQGAADVAQAVGQGHARRAGGGGEVLGGVGVEQRHEQPDGGRGDEAEDDDHRRRHGQADHQQRDRPRQREHGRGVLALEAVAEARGGKRPRQEADPGHDQVGGAVGEAVALVGEQSGSQGQPPVVADVVDEPDADEQRQAARHGRSQQRLDREGLGGRFVGDRLGRRQLLVRVEVLARGLLGLGDDLGGLLGAALRDQPPGRGGQAPPHEQDGETTQRADAEQNPPAAGVVGHEEASDEGDDREARVGAGGGPAGVAAAQRRRRDLAQVRGHGGDLGADAQARDEAEDDEAGDVPARRGERRAHREHDHRHDEAELAAPLVSHLAVGERPDDVADEAAGHRQRHRARGGVELGRDHRQRERDRHDVEEREEVAGADDPQQPFLIWPDRDPVQTRKGTWPAPRAGGRPMSRHRLHDLS